MNELRHIVMVAAENGALKGAKVGGIGDVIRDLPPALAKLDCRVTVILPSYGVLHRRHPSTLQGSFQVPFAGGSETVELYRIDALNRDHKRVRHWVLQHPLFDGGDNGQIYSDDAHEPFATDASKFALFGAAVAEVLMQDPSRMPDAIHLHDWHAATVLLLRRFEPRYRALQAVNCVYSIHNLALQGIRPLADNPSSLASWFPHLQVEHTALVDPRWSDCYNPMLMAINSADQVHTVSPTYAEEIQRANAVHSSGYHGGEGLEAALQRVASEGRLLGILNGCDYPESSASPAGESGVKNWASFLERAEQALLLEAAKGETVRSCHFIAMQRLAQLRANQPRRLLTSVGRVSEQKIGLLLQPDSLGSPALSGILSALGEDSLYIFLGSGQREIEAKLSRAMAEHPNFLFLCCFSEPLANSLYKHGDLFMMPSSFEPCGLSQMLAMREGQPCLVHRVGGLADTVKHEKTGFSFHGENLRDKADQLVLCARAALKLQSGESQRWQQIKQSAKQVKFLWADSARRYVNELYQLAPPKRN